MSKKMRILLLVSETWCTDNSGGNTVNNFFAGMDAEFAQIYEGNGVPNNDTCVKYFRIGENDAIKAFFCGKEVGCTVTVNKEKEDSDNQGNQKVFYNTIVQCIKKSKLNIFYLLKNIIRRYGKWKTEALIKFIKDFDPDVIYAPCYASPYCLELTRFVKKLTGKKVVTWSADDNYSLKQFSLSPFYWINRFWIRRCLRRTYPLYDCFYSASEDEAKELRNIVGKDIKILRKGAHISDTYTRREVHTPIRLIYAGGLYCNRWRSLSKICKAIRSINKNDIKIRLDIYSISKLNKKQLNLLNDGVSCFVHKAVGKDELNALYKSSDIAIHCESFNLKYKLMTRLSFSTKIIDCMESGCAILAIAWKEHTGLKYLKKEDAAICIDNVKKIPVVLNKIVNDPDIIVNYAEKAYICADKNHRIENLQKELYSTFYALANESD